MQEHEFFFLFFETDNTSSVAQEASYPNKIEWSRFKIDQSRYPVLSLRTRGCIPPISHTTSRRGV